uniref:Uncharacterized protein n=1 Tax=Trichinella nativa TaxID=6335 RepID=A0A0V1KGW1_9BILA
MPGYRRWPLQAPYPPFLRVLATASLKDSWGEPPTFNPGTAMKRGVQVSL